ncbi:MAG: hypothetical protein EHM72_14355 [Calditrichaeota bacterium]|nr:MAG: hypothetical protein EHM72_14355 [Calditrichota bacterium]
MKPTSPLFVTDIKRINLGEPIMLKVRTSRVLCAALMITLVLSMTAKADYDETISKTFTVNPGGTLTVNTDLGSIDVTGNGGDEVSIDIKREAGAASDREAKRIFEEMEITFEQRGDDVAVTLEYRDRNSLFDWMRKWRVRVHFVIQVPHEYNVNLKTSGGGISVDELAGRVDAKTSGGGLKFGKIDGPVLGRTSGGGIVLQECTGTADVRTSGGGIDIGQVNGDVEAHTSGGSLKIVQAVGTVDASTSGGSITVEEVMGTIRASTSGGSVSAKISKQPKSDCSLTTSGGSINVYLTEDIKATVDAKTSGGRVTTDFPVTVVGELKKTELQADINGGGPQIYLRTSGGSIHIKSFE